MQGAPAPGEANNKSSFKASAKCEPIAALSYCRYGSGCTHMLDPYHREKFWHPCVPQLSNDQLKTQFICNECGFATTGLKTLQLHLMRKTAWSNLSLVGCRINCLVDYKEWHEGTVMQYHKSGKHHVDFRMANEKRWLCMSRIAFYILERPEEEDVEFKDGDEGRSPVEEREEWAYMEDISLGYTIAQSVLFKIYGNSIQETGHLTKGHVCLTDADKVNAGCVKGSLLYGELLPRGANKALSPDRLDGASASVLFDLGMGTGKILVQAFLQFKNLRYIFGIELSAGRYKVAEEAVLKMVQLMGADSYHVQVHPGRFIIVTEVLRMRTPDLAEEGQGAGEGEVKEQEEGEYVERVLHLQCGNMFDVKNIASADVVMMETDIPADLHGKLHVLLSGMKDSSRILTYLDLRRIWDGTTHSSQNFKQLEANRHQADRYPTSWSVQRGHHFYLWSKANLPPQDASSWSPLGRLGGLVSSVSVSSDSPGNKSPSAMDSPNSPQARSPKTGGVRAEEQSGRCLPFSLLGLFRVKKTTPASEHENSKDRSIIPINADGSRSGRIDAEEEEVDFSESAPSSAESGDNSAVDTPRAMPRKGSKKKSPSRSQSSSPRLDSPSASPSPSTSPSPTNLPDTKLDSPRKIPVRGTIVTALSPKLSASPSGSSGDLLFNADVRTDVLRTRLSNNNSPTNSSANSSANLHLPLSPSTSGPLGSLEVSSSAKRDLAPPRDLLSRDDITSPSAVRAELLDSGKEARGFTAPTSRSASGAQVPLGVPAPCVEASSSSSGAGTSTGGTLAGRGAGTGAGGVGVGAGALEIDGAAQHPASIRSSSAGALDVELRRPPSLLPASADWPSVDVSPRISGSGSCPVSGSGSGKDSRKGGDKECRGGVMEKSGDFAYAGVEGLAIDSTDGRFDYDEPWGGAVRMGGSRAPRSLDTDKMAYAYQQPAVSRVGKKSGGGSFS
mmetsp:Transcript_31399/g.69937  ORF Transcript_31399/g.69937 Transcript_31399/m.69937 type:complete len:955 (+) Transcript_31399:90-2954(+)